MPGATKQAGEAKNVEATVARFYEALSAGDVDAFLKFLMPGGYTEYNETGQLLKVDEQSLRSSWPALLAAGWRWHAVGRDLNVVVADGSAIVTGYRFSSITEPDGDTDTSTLCLSMLWLRKQDSWRLAHVHLSHPDSVDFNAVATTETDVAALQALSNKYGDVVSARDAAGYMDLLADDAVLMPPNGPALSGKASIRPFIERTLHILSSFEDSFEVTTPQEIRVAGEWAYDWGHASYGWKTHGKITEGFNTYLRIWQRQPDASWKLARIIWNSKAGAP